METYSVKKLSGLAGVSVRTLHLYDEIGLLKPSVRTPAGYRLYREPELLRLQQILFYKELDFSLQEIGTILDDPGFDLVRALENHKTALQNKRERLTTLLNTIDKTISKLKIGTNMKHEELYAGLPKEKAEAWRNEAIDKYGSDAIDRSEKSLLSMTKEDLAKLKAEMVIVTEKLAMLVAEDPAGVRVQTLIAKHYAVIRKFWGTHGLQDKQAEAYAGLGELYVSDERYTMREGKADPKFAQFMNKAMNHFAKTLLK